MHRRAAMGARRHNRSSRRTVMKKGQLIAGAVASLFAMGAYAGDAKAPAKDAKAAAGMVKCTGVNECKGKGACGGANHGCAGNNECKGKGWITLAEKDCKAKGGTVLADAAGAMKDMKEAAKEAPKDAAKEAPKKDAAKK